VVGCRSRRARERGLTNAEIGDRLIVGTTTVKDVANLLQKRRLRGRVQAVVLAYESGLLQPGAGTTEDARPVGSGASDQAR
jgi:hypothetical protein